MSKIELGKQYRKNRGYEPRPILIDGDIAKIPLTKGKVALIDACDVALVEQFNWNAAEKRNTFYAKTMVKLDGVWRNVKLHRVLLQAEAGQIVDHINGDGLDNRRANLRLATTSQNNRNQRVRSDSKSGLKGATWSKSNKRWWAQIKAEGRIQSLGYYDTAEEAHAAYVEAAKRHFGEFARAS